MNTEKRIPGYMYDAHTGNEIGPASDEMKASLRTGVRLTRIVAGVKQEFYIHPGHSDIPAYWVGPREYIPHPDYKADCGKPTCPQCSP